MTGRTHETPEFVDQMMHDLPEPTMPAYDRELTVIALTIDAIERLERDEQRRVVEYLMGRFK
jgi:hypothetical protein